MKKPIAIISTTSMIISFVSVFLTLLFLTALWEPMGSLFYSSPDVLRQGPVIPIGNMLYIFGCLTVAVILFATRKSRRFFAIEIISMVFLIAFLPVFTSLLETFQQNTLSAMGINAVLRLNITSRVLTVPAYLMNVSSALCLLSCGMRIANKVCSKS